MEMVQKRHYISTHHIQHEVLSERRYVHMSMKHCCYHTIIIILIICVTTFNFSCLPIYLSIYLCIYESMYVCMHVCIYVDMYLIYVTHEGGVDTMTILILCVTGLGFSSSSVSCHAFASCWICIIGRLPRDSYTSQPSHSITTKLLAHPLTELRFLWCCPLANSSETKPIID